MRGVTSFLNPGAADWPCLARNLFQESLASKFRF